MGLALYFETPECPTCGHSEHIGTWNYTRNVSRMWHTAVPGRKYMVDLEGLTGAEAVPLLDQAIGEMRRYPNVYVALNPPAGCGDYGSFLKWLVQLREVAAEYPKAVWGAWR